MLVDRNQTSCACNEALARAVDSRLRGYLSVRDARVVMGGVAPIPWRAAKAEEFLRGKRLDESTAKQAGEIALEGAKPLKDNIYKVKLAQDLIQPGLLASL
jgi:xanthine dehydrogenase YagS FAD-binding subunit